MLMPVRQDPSDIWNRQSLSNAHTEDAVLIILSVTSAMRERICRIHGSCGSVGLARNRRLLHEAA